MDRLAIKELQKGYENKEFSPVEITKLYLEHTYKCNQRYNAFITITEEVALNQAEVLEKKMMAGYEVGGMFGIPVSYKDIIATKNILTTDGSFLNRNKIPNKNASVVRQLTSCDAITIGKNNLHEFAFGITSNNTHFGPVRNPWNTNCTPGGSSGGSASAIAANMGIISLGTDTGASIRQPAASCGVIGLKPTKGLISTKGVTGISWTLDHVGPITANMSDLSITMENLIGKDFSNLNQDIRGLKIGIPTTFFNEKVDLESNAHFQKSIKALENLGAIVEYVNVPDIDDYQDIASIIVQSETSILHQENINSRLNEYGPDVKDIMATASQFTANDYLNALSTAKRYEEEFIKIFNKIDVIATLTMPTTAPKIGQNEIIVNKVKENLFNYMTRNTMLFNMIGYPALSIPCAIDSKGLPIGLQLISPPYREDLLIKIGFVFETNQLEDFYKIRDSKYHLDKEMYNN